MLLKPSLKDFKCFLASKWNECNCMVVWTFFGIGLPWDWNENWLFQSSGHCWVFQICWHIQCSTLTASSCTILNSSPRNPALLLALFTVMLPKAHLTSHSRISSSMWVTTPSWLSGPLRSFLYSSSMYTQSLLLLFGSYHFCPWWCPSFREMFPWYFQFSWRDL